MRSGESSTPDASVVKNKQIYYRTECSQMRSLLLVALLLVIPGIALGKRAPSRTPVQSAAMASIVLVGTVTDIEKDPLVTTSAPDAQDRISFTIATVKVTDAIRGLKTETHVKVGYTPNARTPLNLSEKQDYLLFLTKHHSGNFYVLNFMSPPVPLTASTKTTVEDVKSVGKILADPAQALKAEKAEEKAFAAMVLIMHYRLSSESGVEQTTEALPLEISQSILQAMGGIDWTTTPQVGGFEIMPAFYQLGIVENDGWKIPEIKPGELGVTVLNKTFNEWLTGAGAKYQIQKFVPKVK